MRSERGGGAERARQRRQEGDRAGNAAHSARTGLGGAGPARLLLPWRVVRRVWGMHIHCVVTYITSLSPQHGAARISMEHHESARSITGPLSVRVVDARHAPDTRLMCSPFRIVFPRFEGGASKPGSVIFVAAFWVPDIGI